MKITRGIAAGCLVQQNRWTKWRGPIAVVVQNTMKAGAPADPQRLDITPKAAPETYQRVMSNGGISSRCFELEEGVDRSIALGPLY